MSVDKKHYKNVDVDVILVQVDVYIRKMECDDSQNKKIKRKQQSI